MERVTLREILERAGGFRRDGTGEPAAFVVADAVEATLLVEGGAEVISVERLSRVEIGAGHVAATNARGERFYFAAERVIGIRVAPPADARRGFR